MNRCASCSVRWVCLWASVGLSVAGCNEVTGVEPTRELEVEVIEGGFPWAGIEPVEGVELCHVDTKDLEVKAIDDCTTTDDQGIAGISLPDKAKVAWSLRKDDYQRVLVPDITDGSYDPATTWPLFTDKLLAELCQLLREELACDYPLDDTGYGWISVFTRPRREGATFTLVGATGDLFYTAPAGRPSPGFETTTQNGDALFINVLPGDVEIRFGGTAEGCTPRQSWPGAGDHTIALPVREGFHTYVGLNCLGVAP